MQGSIIGTNAFILFLNVDFVQGFSIVYSECPSGYGI